MKDKFQMDTHMRVVSIANLQSMCSYVSSTCHRYWIESITKNRVKIGYSNPDEYGNEYPMYAIFPCYEQDLGGKKLISVVLDIIRIVFDPWDEGYHAFVCLLECPQMFRDPKSGNWEFIRRRES